MLVVALASVLVEASGIKKQQRLGCLLSYSMENEEYVRVRTC